MKDPAKERGSAGKYIQLKHARHTVDLVVVLFLQPVLTDTLLVFATNGRNINNVNEEIPVVSVIPLIFF